MEKKNEYIIAAVHIIKCDKNDIITASDPGNGGDNELPDMLPDD